MTRIAALIGLILTALVLTAASASAARLRFGAFDPPAPYQGIQSIDALEQALGRRVSIVNWFQSWGGSEYLTSVQTGAIEAVARSGRTPMITWQPTQEHVNGFDQPQFRLARIAHGDFDAYIASWARGLRDTGVRIYLRPMHEMNGGWYPWGGLVNGNSPRLFKVAWRRMHRIFAATGARNVRWVWSPLNVDVPATRANRMERYYPGRKYVDVLGMTGYNWASPAPDGGGWRSFRRVFARPYKRLRHLGHQPIWITEVGVDASGGDKAAWVRDMFSTARRWKRLRAIVWFNHSKERDWRATSPPSAASAFRQKP
jgi:beta-mannanase